MSVRNQKLLDHLIKHKFAVEDVGDGAWGWTEEGKKLPDMVKALLSDLLYNEKVPKYHWHILIEEGFSAEGYLGGIE